MPFIVRAFILACALIAYCNCGVADEALLKRGEALFGKQCASCHGKTGQGVSDKYDKPLTGRVSLGELEELITDTMPENDPEQIIGDDAKAVAAFIHKSFYGASTEQPRIRLARLTAPQLRQSVADLASHFLGIANLSQEQGLRGVYYAGSRPNSKNKKIDRVDTAIDFDFADKGPGKEIPGNDFAIQWSGGLKIDVTGRYELAVRSSCAFVFYLGSQKREFINNHVQSGDKTEFRRSIMLTAGRVYPIRINFYQRKRKTKQPPANFKLSWVPPHGTEQAIPSRNLRSNYFPAAYSLQAKLPPDDRSYGYERGIAVDRQWDESTTTAAIEVAQIAIDELWPRFQQQNKGPNPNRAKLRKFLNEFVLVAFRGPVDETSRQLYIDGPIAACESDADAIKRSVLMALKSPRFLYPQLDMDRSVSQRAANRLTLTLFDSLPSDSWLIQQVGKDHFKHDNIRGSISRIRTAASRMVSDYRTRGKTREMLYAWLNMSHFDDINKDAKRFPNFDAELVSDLRASLDVFLDEVVWSEKSDFRELVNANWAFTNDRIQRFYGDQWKPDSNGTGFRKTAAGSHHTGLLAHPYLMSGLAYPDSTSPIHRGVFVIRYMLGRTLRPPQEAFTPLSPELHPDLTTRERISLQTSPNSCQVCHVKINALGFTLENFDAVGRYRVTERDKPIDTEGGYTDRSGKRTKINGPQALSSFLASSDDAHRAFVERAFQHFVKQPPAAYGPNTLPDLIKRFKEQQFNIRELLIDIAVVAASDVLTDADENSPVTSAPIKIPTTKPSTKTTTQTTNSVSDSSKPQIKKIVNQTKNPGSNANGGTKRIRRRVIRKVTSPR